MVVRASARPGPKRQRYTGSNTPRHRVDSSFGAHQSTHCKASCILQRNTLSLSWNRPLFLAHHIPLPAPIIVECGTRWDVLTKFPTVTLQNSGITIDCGTSSIFIASWASTTLQLATMMEPIDLSSAPYIHGSFRVRWLLMKRVNGDWGR